jgi:hypothetical protein
MIEHSVLAPFRIVFGPATLCAAVACAGSVKDLSAKSLQPSASTAPVGSALSEPVASATPSQATATAVPRRAPSTESKPRETEQARDAPSEPASEPLPDGFVAAVDDGSLECGDFRIESPEEPDGSFTRFVRVLNANGDRVYQAHGRREQGGGSPRRMNLSADLCGDLTGDGVPELVMTESSGGAHCCYTYYVVSLTTPPRRLLMWEKGDANIPLRPVKLGPGPAWQLEGSVVFWPPFDAEHGEPVLSYAMAPLVPAVLSLVGGAYALTSFSFPEVYRHDREALRAHCAADNNCDPDDVELNAWLDSLVIGDWSVERAKVSDQVLRAALDRRSVATRKMLVQRLGSLSAPASLSPHE